MASMDNVYDLLEMLEKDGFNFLLITVQRGDKEHKSSLAHNITFNDALNVISRQLLLFKDAIKKMEFNEKGNIKNDNSD